MDDPDSICIVRECRELEAAYDLKCTDAIFSRDGSVGQQDIKKEILLADRTLLLDGCTK